MRSATACAALAGTLLTLALSAGPAWAQTEGHALDLTGPATATAGRPVVLQATGHYPATDFFSSWLAVHAIPTSVVSTCPAGYLNSSQLAGSTYAQGGETIAIAQRAMGDETTGRYSMPFAFTPRVPGQFIVCGYANDGATWTHAMDSLVIAVRSGGSPAGAGVTTPPPAPTGGETTAPTGGGMLTASPEVGVSRSYTATRRATRLRTLRISGVPSGSKVVATCRYKGRKCAGKARRTFRKRDAAGTVALATFTRVTLKAGSVIRVRVSKPGSTTATKLIRIRRNAAPLITTAG